MLGNTLLVICDDIRWCDSTVRYFSKVLNYQIYVATGGAEAVKLAEELCPDFIVLDYHLRDGNAETLAKIFRSSESLWKTLIVVVGGDDSCQGAAYDKCQADHFALKTVPRKAIHEAICALRRRLCWERGIVEKGDLKLEAAGFRVFLNSRPFLRLSEDRFLLLSLLVEKSPCFVPEDVIVKRVYKTELTKEKSAALKMLIYRLKYNLRQYSNRIRNRRGLGWAYFP